MVLVLGRKIINLNIAFFKYFFVKIKFLYLFFILFYFKIINKFLILI